MSARGGGTPQVPPVKQPPPPPPPPPVKPPPPPPPKPAAEKTARDSKSAGAPKLPPAGKANPPGGRQQPPSGGRPKPARARQGATDVGRTPTQDRTKTVAQAAPSDDTGAGRPEAAEATAGAAKLTPPGKASPPAVDERPRAAHPLAGSRALTPAGKATPVSGLAKAPPGPTAASPADQSGTAVAGGPTQTRIGDPVQPPAPGSPGLPTDASQPRLVRLSPAVDEPEPRAPNPDADLATPRLRAHKPIARARDPGRERRVRTCDAAPPV